MTGPLLTQSEPNGTSGAAIRVGVIAGCFFLITAGLLFIQPSMDEPAPRVTPQQVSRAETGLDLVTPVTDPAPQDRLGAAVALASAPAQAAPSYDMSDMTRAILSDLGQPASPTQDTDQFRDMTAGVLASLQQGAALQKASLETLVVQSLRQGQSDAFIDALLNEAAATGQIAVPAALVTAEGKVDTATLLATLVRKSDGSAAATHAPGARPAQAITPPTRQQSYVVKSGDSLGAIAHRFYGDAALYSAIFDANREILSGPNAIRTGQRLTIPAL